MQCYCCDREITTARKVKLRPWRDYDAAQGGPDSAAYKSYLEETTYRWAVVCQACYSTLDNALGLAEVGGKLFNIAGASRRDKAATVDEAKYRAFRRKEAERLGLELEEDAEQAAASGLGGGEEALMKLFGRSWRVRSPPVSGPRRTGRFRSR